MIETYFAVFSDFMVLRLPLLLLADDYFVLGCFPGIQGDGDAGVCLFFGDDKDAV